MYDRIDTIQKQLQKILPTNRYNHTLGVAYLAASLAMCYNEDTSKAMIAGLLHDVAKCKGDEELLHECKNYGLLISPVEQSNPFLLHAKLGSYYAKTQFGIEDEEVLTAISYHTTGKPEMTFLEKVIFVSDFIEVRRKQPSNPDLTTIRKVAFQNIDLAVEYVLEATLKFLKDNHRQTDDTTQKAYEYYKLKRS